jgi:trimeric autotransporter adhesin
VTRFALATFSVTLVLSVAAAPAASSRPRTETKTSIENFLRADGTLDLHTGFSGTLDVAGFEIASVGDGPPRFRRSSAPLAPSSSCDPDASWSGDFARPVSGLDNTVYAAAAIGTDVYVGGSFTMFVGNFFPSGKSVNYIAKWNGSVWSAVGTGVNDRVLALAVIGTDLYAGGRFTTAGGGSANHIAKWDGSAWSALGSGTDDWVNALAVMGTDLYAGGQFGTAGGVSASYVAKWNGSNWSALGLGTNNAVDALTVNGTDVYAGGTFTQAGGVSANRIAKWDGSAWSALGTGVNATVWALAAMGSDLYAGGDFTLAGAVGANHIARWDGTQWQLLGSGPGNGTGNSLASSAVRALVVRSGLLYAGGVVGAVHQCSNGGCTQVEKMNNASGDCNAQPGCSVYALTVSAADLYVGGDFTLAGMFAPVAKRVAKWNGSVWSGLHDVGPELGANDAVETFAKVGTDLYIGGVFTGVGEGGSARAARWNGSAWSPTGGFNNTVYALAANGLPVYAAGAFSQVNVANTTIAKYDGSQWLPAGMSTPAAPIYALAVSPTYAYAGGAFTSNISRFDGSTWSTFGSGMNGTVYAVALSGTDLYAGGAFTAAGGGSANYIAKWDGSTWSALGSGMNGTVNALLVNGTDVYAGGAFTTAGGTSANYIAKWDGSTWSALGTGMDNTVDALAMRGTDLFAGGAFTTAGGMTANQIAKWSGSTWSALGSGTGATVRAIAAVGTNVYAGGDFTSAGGKASHYFGRWQTCGNCSLDSGEQCDDGNTVNGDGCSAGCAVEIGWSCTGEPSTCTQLTPTQTSTATATATASATSTATATSTNTAVDTVTSTTTATASATPTATATSSKTPSATATPSDTASATATATATSTATQTGTATATATATVSATPSVTSTFADTPTPTATFAAGCPATPAVCAAAGKGSLGLKYDATSGLRKLKWKWKKGVAAQTQSSFGDPVGGGTAYALCLYDTTGGAAVLKMGVSIPAGGTCGTQPCWKALAQKGWSYKNTSGITKVLLIGGAAGKPSLQVRGKGMTLPLPAPLSGSQYFDEDPAVVIQLHSSNTMSCWSSSFAAAGTVRNAGGQFQASSP